MKIGSASGQVSHNEFGPNHQPTRRYLTPVLLSLGTLLLQCAWILTVPPFRGIDEFDHAYRASSVAHGHWIPDRIAAENGRGDVIAASRSIVEAAYAECNALPYTGSDNCSAIEDRGDGTVTVASAAARYHPLFYWLIGKPSMNFEGATALYVMRGVSAVMCAAFLGAAAFVLGLWSRTTWPIRCARSVIDAGFGV